MPLLRYVPGPKSGERTEPLADVARLLVHNVGWDLQHCGDVAREPLLTPVGATVLDRATLVLPAGGIQNIGSALLEVTGLPEELHDGPRH